MKSQLTRILPRAYSIVDQEDEAIAEGLLIAFSTQGDVWQAVEMATDGSIVQTLAELDVVGFGVLEPPSGQNACLIREQTTALTWRDDDRIRAWHLEENALYEHEAPADRIVSPPVFHGGALYWLELPVNYELTWRLMESTPTFAGTQVRGLADPDPLGFGFVFEWHPPKVIAHTGSSVIGSAFWRTLDSAEGVATVRFPLGQSAETSPENDTLGREDDQDRAVLLPHADRAFGAVIATDGDGGGSSLIVLENDAEAVTSVHWPRSGDWWITNTKNGDTFNSRGLIYGEASGTRKVLVAAIDGPHVEPEHIIEPQTINGQAPDLIFLGGES